MDEKEKKFELYSFNSFHIKNIDGEKIDVHKGSNDNDTHVINIHGYVNIFFETLESLHYFTNILFEKSSALIIKRDIKQ